MDEPASAFGRRAPPIAAEPDPEPGAADTLPLAEWRGLRQLGGVLMGVGIVAAVLLGQRLMMKQAGHALADHYEDVGYPALDRAYTSVDGGDQRLAQAHQTCKRNAASARLPATLRTALEPMEGVLEGESALVTSAAYVGCLSKTDAERFCRPAHRAHFVAAVNDYGRLRAKVKEEWRFGSHVGAVMVQAPTATQGVQTALPSDGLDPKVTEAVARVIASGRLPIRELKGKGVTRELQAVARAARTKAAPCP